MQTSIKSSSLSASSTNPERLRATVAQRTVASTGSSDRKRSSRLLVHDADLFMNDIAQAMEPVLVDEQGNEVYPQERKTQNHARFTRSSTTERFGRPDDAPLSARDRSVNSTTVLPSLMEAQTYRDAVSHNTKRSAAHRRLVETQKRRRQEQYQAEIDRVRRDVQRQRQAYEKKQEEKFVNDYNTLVAERHNFVEKHVKEAINLKRSTDERKRQLLYEDWVKNVWNPIQREIVLQLSYLPPNELHRRRVEMFDKYLSVSNKRDLFRDIIMESEYDPLQYNSTEYSITCNASVRDPTKKSANRHREEMSALRTMESLMRGVNPANDEEWKNTNRATEGDGTRKDMLDITLWGRADDTVAGYYNKMMLKAESYKNKIPTEIDHLKERLMRSRVTMDHYAYPRGYESVRQETQPGKRVTRDALNAKPERTRNKKVVHKGGPGAINIFDDSQPEVPQRARHYGAATMTHLRGAVVLEES